MGRAIIMHIDEAPWKPGYPRTGPDGRPWGSRLIGDNEAGPWIHINAVEPGKTVPPHSHTQDEVIFIVEGSIITDGRELGPGTVVYVERDTEYGFSAGNEGVRFLNIRNGPAAFQVGGKTADPHEAIRRASG